MVTALWTSANQLSNAIGKHTVQVMVPGTRTTQKLGWNSHNHPARGSPYSLTGNQGSMRVVSAQSLRVTIPNLPGPSSTQVVALPQGQKPSLEVAAPPMWPPFLVPRRDPVYTVTLLRYHHPGWCVDKEAACLEATTRSGSITSISMCSAARGVA